jgi:hypothetical protein
MLFTNIEFAKITIFPNIPEHLIKKSTFFNFFLEIEEILFCRRDSDIYY